MWKTRAPCCRGLRDAGTWLPWIKVCPAYTAFIIFSTVHKCLIIFKVCCSRCIHICGYPNDDILLIFRRKDHMITPIKMDDWSNIAIYHCVLVHQCVVRCFTSASYNWRVIHHAQIFIFYFMVSDYWRFSTCNVSFYFSKTLEISGLKLSAMHKKTCHQGQNLRGNLLFPVKKIKPGIDQLVCFGGSKSSKSWLWSEIERRTQQDGFINVEISEEINRHRCGKASRASINWHVIAVQKVDWGPNKNHRILISEHNADSKNVLRLSTNQIIASIVFSEYVNSQHTDSRTKWLQIASMFSS